MRRRVWDQILYWAAVISFTGIWFPFLLVLLVVVVGTWILAGGR